MKRSLIPAATILGMTLFLGGCITPAATDRVSPHMERITGEASMRPEPGKALVVSMRPGRLGWAVNATIYDKADTPDYVYLGTVSYGSRIPYQAEPGRHLFMVVGESADFMQADLEAGKTYYVVVAARMGAWKARFSFRPDNGQIPESERRQWLADTVPLRPGKAGFAWAKEHANSIEFKRSKYLPAWRAKADKDKQVLKAASGH